MKTITIYLPDMAYSQAEQHAAALGMDVVGVCSLLLTERLAAEASRHTESRPRPQTSRSRLNTTNKTVPESQFNVTSHFPDLPRTSTVLAQGFIDEALKLPRTKAFKSNRGIGIEPNFVFVEYLRSRGTPGLVASFYGRPSDFHDPKRILRNGRGSYSRADISTQEDLDAAIPIITQAWERKFGR